MNEGFLIKTSASNASSATSSTLYEQAVAAGFEGTETEFNNALSKIDQPIYQEEKGNVGGVASLGDDGKVPYFQLPDFVKTSEKGVANGVASLGADGKVPETQLPETSSEGDVGESTVGKTVYYYDANSAVQSITCEEGAEKFNDYAISSVMSNNILSQGNNSVGPYSATFGTKNFVKGEGSFCAGRDHIVNGDCCAAIGNHILIGTGTNNTIDDTSAIKGYTVAIGNNSYITKGGWGFSIGSTNEITGAAGGHIIGSSDKILNSTGDNTSSTGGMVIGYGNYLEAGNPNFIFGASCYVGRANTAYYPNITPTQSNVMYSICMGQGNEIITGKYCTICGGKDNDIASGDYNYVEGYNNKITTSGNNHVEGNTNKITSSNGSNHIEGIQHSVSGGGYSHLENGYQTLSGGTYIHMEGQSNQCQAGNASHIEGYINTHTAGSQNHLEGEMNTCTSGTDCHLEGYFNTTNGGNATHIEGYHNQPVNGKYCHVEGMYNTINSTSVQNVHISGKYNTATYSDMCIIGRAASIPSSSPSDTGTTGNVFIVGNGKKSTSGDVYTAGNAFRVSYAGSVYGQSAFNSTGADYAEYFEWLDNNPNNEDRVGHFVAMIDDKIILANSNDYVLGVVSGQPCIIGNSDEDWLGRWEHDEFGRFIKEYLKEVKTEIEPPDDEEEKKELLAQHEIEEQNGMFYKIETEVVDYETPLWRYKANPNYDPTQQYVERKDRKEWSAVGMLGVLSVRDDGTCSVNSYCKVTNGGIATSAEEYIPGKTWRVIKRMSNNVIQIVFR